MKAFVSEKYGPPEMLRMAEVKKPTPAADEALVKVLAVSVNPADWRSMRATPFFSRATLGLLRPKHRILGGDIAGRVEAVGSDVNQFKPGDEVYANLLDHGNGGLPNTFRCQLKLCPSSRQTYRLRKRLQFRWRGSPHSRAFVTTEKSGPGSEC
jgi:NADPH:quinone reductase-like Zn-dependent oxidoreductase